MKLSKTFLPISLLSWLFLWGCASTDDLADSNAENLGAEHYVLESMYIERQMPRRPAAEDARFFYKECESTDGRAYYSKTSYDCTQP
ncbi:MAG: hypothetical protein H6626_06695 [Pseudobdellovibrionaceae bacterium]|nr:hypothetical protein [Bdellovibrionales bacterium]USN48773.1 MAG: hypothetical protein H6626_06695 [Pseudobdellovibrionaceae bacterium]